MDEQQNTTATASVDKETLWVLDNYILLKDYLDRTISRIAARCIRKGNIAIEEYPFYGYILDILEEISESGDFILAHKELHPLVEKKIQGGMSAFKKNLNDFKVELKNNSTPDMIKQDNAQELAQMKEALGMVDKTQDPTAGAGMSMDAVIEKLMSSQNLEAAEGSSLAMTQQASKSAQPQAPVQQPSVPSQSVPAQQPAAQPQAATPSADASGQPKIIKKIVKIVKPAVPQGAPAVPEKVSEE